MPRRLPDIDPERCTGCGRCIAACAPHVLALERRGWEKVLVLLDAQGCTGCHHCAWRCPFEAIAMLYRTSRRESELTPRIRPPCGAMEFRPSGFVQGRAMQTAAIPVQSDRVDEHDPLAWEGSCEQLFHACLSLEWCAVGQVIG